MCLLPRFGVIIQPAEALRIWENSIKVEEQLTVRLHLTQMIDGEELQLKPTTGD
jgi:hypothetical protein